MQGLICIEAFAIIGSLQAQGHFNWGIRLSKPVYRDDFEGSEIVFFDNHGAGVSYNSATGKVRFYLYRERWKKAEFDATDLRGIEKIKVNPAEYDTTVFGSIGKKMGTATADAIRNMQVRADAKRQTGVQINIRSVDLPKFFLQIASDAERDRLSEALHQIIDGQGVSGQIAKFPSNGSLVYRADAERKAEVRAKAKSFLVPSKKEMKIILWPCAAFYAWLLYKNTGDFDPVHVIFDTISFIPLLLILGGVIYAGVLGAKLLRSKKASIE